jgi:hypothetical protein
MPTEFAHLPLCLPDGSAASGRARGCRGLALEPPAAGVGPRRAHDTLTQSEIPRPTRFPSTSHQHGLKRCAELVEAAVAHEHNGEQNLRVPRQVPGPTRYVAVPRMEDSPPPNVLWM